MLEVDPVNHVETYILQDVSGNVVGAVDPNDEYHVEQFFDPYGLWERVTSIWTTINGTSYVTLDPDDGVDDATEYMWTTTGLHGHFYDRESGLYWMRGRYYPPRWQRFLSNDPIGTGLLPVTSLSYGGMPFAIDVAVNAGTQFTDGPNPYEFVRSNPITGRDPSGLVLVSGPNSFVITRNWDDIYESIVGDSSAYLGAQGAATYAGYWGENLASLPRMSKHWAGLSHGFFDFADYYADQVRFLPVEGVFAAAGAGAFGRFAAAGGTGRPSLFARVARHAYELHHLLPQAPRLAQFFRRAGLNIEHFVIKIPLWKHRLKPGGIHTGKENWNAIWEAFVFRNPNAEKKEVLQQLKMMVRDFGLEDYVGIVLPP